MVDNVFSIDVEDGIIGDFSISDTGDTDQNPITVYRIVNGEQTTFTVITPPAEMVGDGGVGGAGRHERRAPPPGRVVTTSRPLLMLLPRAPSGVAGVAGAVLLCSWPRSGWSSTRSRTRPTS